MHADQAKGHKRQERGVSPNPSQTAKFASPKLCEVLFEFLLIPYHILSWDYLSQVAGFFAMLRGGRL